MAQAKTQIRVWNSLRRRPRELCSSRHTCSKALSLLSRSARYCACVWACTFLRSISGAFTQNVYFGFVQFCPFFFSKLTSFVFRNSQVFFFHHTDTQIFTDKIRKYRADYNNRPPSAVSFMPAIASTSGRLHSEYVRILFLQTHRETDRFFATSAVQLVQTQPGVQFTFHHATFLTLSEQSRPDSC